ncbi:uncharacterized protein DUF222 [Microcella alkaliphila]|uniref:Uncharacterized protein DUF222 n=1 Tax=Microcella alkaliphila TaxID=279828 RepID=A0A4Q7TWR9_9MICO|nr:HNH endonuclease signature motif containing protein [Microcella alkaliphila]RZT64398.1 uncharacterized protein DUF222 [Microcella alkaliphila]
MSEIAALLGSAVAALTAVPRSGDAYRGLDDAALLALTRVAADEVRLAQLHVSLLAGEIARRSAPELGSDGLAQREGHRTPEEMVRVTTGTRVADARAAVRVGVAAGAPSPTPLTSAVIDGRVSVAVADAVVGALGRPAAGVTQPQLDEAAAAMVERVAGLDPERAAREARAARDELDLAGIATREQAARERRGFRLGRRAAGGGYAHWELDPETFAVVSEIYDRVTSPRRNLPSFDDGTAAGPSALRATSDSAASGGAEADPDADERTLEQYTSDVFAELLRQGVSADTEHLLGDSPVGVRVVVAAATLAEGRGGGYLEGQPDPVSLATVERLGCATGTVAITVDHDGQPLNLGREQRLYSRSQRIALAARDGGCRWPGCERPPSWCEAHHINHWLRDGGRTDVADGILLCRHHHRLAHNNGWEITRAGPTYLLHPPERGPGGASGGDPESASSPPRTAPPREMPSRSRALRDALKPPA